MYFIYNLKTYINLFFVHALGIRQTCTVTWRWCMGMFGARFAVFVRRARVLPTPCHATRNLSFWRFHRHRHPVVSTRCFTGTGTGWCENSTRWKSYKLVQARGGGAWACLTHGLQCLCDGRACCPPRAMQLVCFYHLYRYCKKIQPLKNNSYTGIDQKNNNLQFYIMMWCVTVYMCNIKY